MRAPASRSILSQHVFSSSYPHNPGVGQGCSLGNRKVKKRLVAFSGHMVSSAQQLVAPHNGTCIVRNSSGPLEILKSASTRTPERFLSALGSRRPSQRHQAVPEECLRLRSSSTRLAFGPSAFDPRRTPDRLLRNSTPQVLRRCRAQRRFTKWERAPRRDPSVLYFSQAFQTFRSPTRKL